MGVKFIKIKASDDGMRLNRWFLKEYPSLSLGRLQKLLRTKQIKVDGKRAEASTKLMMGQELRLPPLDNERSVNIDIHRLCDADKEYIQNMVIYKDDNIIVLNKPSGIAVQGGTNTTRHIDGMLEALCFEKDEKPKLVHRIDKETSGILVLARDRYNAELLTKAFANHDLQKTYLALCIGVPKEKEGVVKLPIEGKEAVTEYEVIGTDGNDFSLVKLKPLSGRKHQIRIHMEFLGCPIVGDDKYFIGERMRYDVLKDKLHLHAFIIDLSSIYNKDLVLKTDLSMYFKTDIDRLGINFTE